MQNRSVGANGYKSSKRYRKTEQLPTHNIPTQISIPYSKENLRIKNCREQT